MTLHRIEMNKMVKSSTGIRLSRFAASIATMAAVACATQGTSENVRSTRQALWTNGGFESNNVGDQPTGWTITTNLDPGITVQTPQTLVGLNLAAGGVLESSVVGGAQNSQTDPDVTLVTYPKYGMRSLRLNYLSPSLDGTNRNVNSADQSMTIAPGDIDPVDGKVHVRFVILPVLQNPGHTPQQQPYYFVELTNVTKSNAILYQDFNYSAYPGVPWLMDPSDATILYTDWQLVDVAPGSAQLAIGDTVDLRIIASGCAAGGHWGRVYVDGVGSTIPGPFVSATGPQAQNAGANVTYTFNYRNGGTASALASSVTFVTPANTTFVSASIPGCTGLAAAATGTETCALGDVPVGGTGSFQITVAIDPAPVAGTVITNGNYEYLATGLSPLLGPKVSTTVTTGVTYADLALTLTDGVAAVGWGLPVSYTIVATNAGPSAVTGATVTDTMPAQLTGVTWTCVGAGGATCAASGTGSIADATVALPKGGSVTYTVLATVVAGTGTGTLSNVASVAVPAGAVDPDATNNAAGDSDALGTVRTLTLTKNGAQVGAVSSVPASLVCATGCASATGSFLDGSTVILNETPAVGWTFQGWTGACLSAGSASACTFTMSGDQAVGATFFGPPATVTVVGNNTQAAGVGLPLAPLTVTVKDALGDPLPGVTVTFTAPDSGASATLGAGGVAVTDASGVATVSATANATPGAYAVTATTVGIGTPASFALDNFGAPATVAVSGGAAQSATVGTAFGTPLMVTVLDALGQPVPNVTVTFTAPGTGASATFGVSIGASDAGIPDASALDASATPGELTATTGATGTATILATADMLPGSYDVSATVTGVANPASFPLTNVAGGVAAISIVSGTPQTAVAGAAFAEPLQVLVVDAFGNPVEGATVTFTAPGTGASATTSTLTAITNATGLASVTAAAGAIAGTYTVTASTAGATTPASFALTNTPGLANDAGADATTDDGGTLGPDAAVESGGPVEVDATVPTEPPPAGDEAGSVTGGGLSCSAASRPSTPPSGAALLLGFVGLAVFARTRRRR
jgi:uncharacterized repeat protein (TIGR01451 family)